MAVTKEAPVAEQKPKKKKNADVKKVLSYEDCKRLLAEQSKKSV